MVDLTRRVARVCPSSSSSPGIFIPRHPVHQRPCLGWTSSGPDTANSVPGPTAHPGGRTLSGGAQSMSVRTTLAAGTPRSEPRGRPGPPGVLVGSGNPNEHRRFLACDQHVPGRLQVTGTPRGDLVSNCLAQPACAVSGPHPAAVGRDTADTGVGASPESSPRGRTTA